ncbi:MAG: hypothetical protein WBF42_13950 [Terracidiphilus sp.]
MELVLESSETDMLDSQLLQSDHDMLVELRTLMQRLLMDVKEMHTRFIDDAVDMNRRVSRLENFRWWIMGAAGMLGFLGSLLTRLLR